MKTSKIRKYAESSSLMNISISYGDEEFSFNLFNELVVNENIINKEIKEQPSSHAFLAMLLTKLTRIEADSKKEMENAFSKMYIFYKNELDTNTNRPISNDLAKEKTINSKKYQVAVSRYNTAKENRGIIETCVKAFEERGSLIQTLSANIRNN